MNTLNRILIWLLCVAVLCGLLVGGVIWYIYYAVSPEVIPPAVQLSGQSVACTEWAWDEPILGGLLTKSISGIADTVRLEPLTSPTLELSVPQEYTCEARLYREGEPTAVAAASSSASFQLTENGNYVLSVVLRGSCEKNGRSQGCGVFTYYAPFVLNAEPIITLSAQRVQQGDIVVATVTGLLDNVRPTIESPLSPSVFVPTEQGYTAYLGVSYNREPGEYPVTVRAGSSGQTQTVTVVHRNFDRRTIVPLPAEGSVPEWQGAVFPTFDTMTPQRLWNGRFIPPSLSLTAAGYGDFLRTEDGSHQSRSAGIDYLSEGQPLTAPAEGRVLWAGHLSLTGSTVILDHGAGLKSYFYHLSTIECLTGDNIAAGQTVGYGGARPAHYEARIGNQSVDPAVLWTPGSHFYRSCPVTASTS